MGDLPFFGIIRDARPDYVELTVDQAAKLAAYLANLSRPRVSQSILQREKKCGVTGYQKELDAERGWRAHLKGVLAYNLARPVQGGAAQGVGRDDCDRLPPPTGPAPGPPGSATTPPESRLHPLQIPGDVDRVVDALRGLFLALEADSPSLMDVSDAWDGLRGAFGRVPKGGANADEVDGNGLANVSKLLALIRQSSHLNGEAKRALVEVLERHDRLGAAWVRNENNQWVIHRGGDSLIQSYWAKVREAIWTLEPFGGNPPSSTRGHHEVGAPTATPQPASTARRTPKRVKGQGGKLVIVISTLTKHHTYAEGGGLNQVPIGNNDLAAAAKVSKATASAFFKAKFKGHAKYCSLCRDSGLLATALKMLNGELSPTLLYGRRPPGEDDRGDD